MEAPPDEMRGDPVLDRQRGRDLPALEQPVQRRPAVHLAVDLVSGEFSIGSAGHLPVGHFDAGSGRWGLIDADGPALGLIPDAAYTRTSGTLRPGDALLLYTDGLVEVPGRDLERGIDKLLGEAERLVPRGFHGGGRVLVHEVAEGSTDDRGLVLLWRAP